MEDRMRVAVVGLADGPEAEVGAAILACLDPTRYERFALLAEPNEAGALREGIADHRRLLPHPSDPAFVGALLEGAARDGWQALLGGSVECNRVISAASESLAHAGVAVHGSDTRHLDQLYLDPPREVVESAELSAAQRIVVPDQPVAELFHTHLCWPLLFVGAGGERRWAADSWEALRAIESLRERSSAVAYISCDPLRVFELALVMDDDGRLLGSSAVRVLANDACARPWMAVTIQPSVLAESAARLARELGVAGPLQFQFTHADGQFTLLDIQPGFPAWIEVVTRGGPNLVELSLRKVPGHVPASPAPHTPPGVLFSQTAEDYVVETTHNDS